MSWGMMLGLWAMIAVFATTGYLFVNLDKQGLFNIPEREPGIMLLAADGSVLAERGAFFGDAVRIDELPPYVPQAIIAIEDRRFYSHFGVDPIGIARALLCQLAGQGHCAGRLDHYPAACKEPVSQAGAHA
jgi:penicillin-binding protein 1A